MLGDGLLDLLAALWLTVMQDLYLYQIRAAVESYDHVRSARTDYEWRLGYRRWKVAKCERTLDVLLCIFGVSCRYVCYVPGAFVVLREMLAAREQQQHRCSRTYFRVFAVLGQ